jgi:stalled ribosome rescue protein Dom34
MAVLVGLDNERAALWVVYSESIKQHGFIDRPADSDSHKDAALYNFYNAIIAEMKPILSTGLASLVVASTRVDASLAESFIAHIRKHHAYLLRAIRMTSITGDAMTVNAARALVKTDAFQSVTIDVTNQESDVLVRVLDAKLSDSTGRVTVLFSLEEIDRYFRNLSKAGEAAVEYPEYVLMTDTFWAARKNDPRLQRVMDLAKNASVKTSVLRSDGQAGSRVAQLGGLVCFTAPKVR